MLCLGVALSGRVGNYWSGLEEAWSGRLIISFVGGMAGQATID
jgi:hypothetical protein